MHETHPPKDAIHKQQKTAFSAVSPKPEVRMIDETNDVASDAVAAVTKKRDQQFLVRP
jgi:hypothetical protein